MVNAQTGLPILFVPHGGGPLPLMNDAAHKSLVTALNNLATTFEKPSAILVITAHWEAKKILISSHDKPSMLFDYSGFPPETYTYSYPAPGNPALAKTCLNLLSVAGIDAELDPDRGFDHGTFVPLMLIYPEANIPVVQISLHHSLDPRLHLQVGKAITSLSEQGVLILGSGMSFHNMNAFFNPTDYARNASEQFDAWLVKELCFTDTSNSAARTLQQESLLRQWTSMPFARFCHPREEHLLPLLVCVGAAQGRPATQFFSDNLLNMRVSGFRWD